MCCESEFHDSRFTQTAFATVDGWKWLRYVILLTRLLPTVRCEDRISDAQGQDLYLADYRVVSYNVRICMTSIRPPWVPICPLLMAPNSVCHLESGLLECMESQNKECDKRK